MLKRFNRRSNSIEFNCEFIYDRVDHLNHFEVIFTLFFKMKRFGYRKYILLVLIVGLFVRSVWKPVKHFYFVQRSFLLNWCQCARIYTDLLIVIVTEKHYFHLFCCLMVSLTVHAYAVLMYNYWFYIQRATTQWSIKRTWYCAGFVAWRRILFIFSIYKLENLRWKPTSAIKKIVFVETQTERGQNSEEFNHEIESWFE